MRSCAAWPLMLLLVAQAAPAAPVAPVLRAETPSEERLREARTPVEGAPTPVAVRSELIASSLTHGSWSPGADGSASWELRLESPGAAEIAVTLGAFGLPEDALVELVDEKGRAQAFEAALFGPQPRWLPLVPGDALSLRVRLPAAVSPDEVLLVTGEIAHGFLGPDAPKADECEIDVVCPEGDDWRDEIRSALRYTYPVPPDFIALCSGQLVMDQPASFRAWVLTADHCGVTNANDQDVVVYWNDQASTCGGPRDGSHAQNQLGAILRWNDPATDTTLLELTDDPAEAFGVHYSGWDATDAVPTGVVAIHHPAGDEKSISLSDRVPIKIDNCLEPQFRNTHWDVLGWDAGVTEGGSSGSAIWDQDNKRVIGVLSGGASFCATPNLPDCYGRLAVAFQRGLADWLDPNRTGTLSVAGSDPIVDECGGLPDADGDGVKDDCDVCPAVPDPDQEDLDADGSGDACDSCVKHPDPDPGCDFVYGDTAPPGAPDGEVDVADVLRLLRAAVGLEIFTGRDFEAANVAPADTDGMDPPTRTPTGENPRELDVSDVQLVLRAAVGFALFPAPS